MPESNLHEHAATDRSMHDDHPERRRISQAQTFGAHLRAWRMILGLTAQQVSERASINRKTLGRLEDGDGNVGVEAILAVASALGIADSIIASVDPLNTDLGRARAHLINRRRAR